MAEVGVAGNRTQWIDFVPTWDETTNGPEIVIELLDPEPIATTTGDGRLWSKVLGWVALVVAVIGVVFGVALIWLGVGAVDRAAATLDDGLSIADETLEAILDTLDVAEGTIATTADSLLEMQVSLGSVSGSMNRVDGLLGETSDIVASEIAPSIDSLLVALPGLVEVGDALDRTLRSLSFLGVPYDPNQPIGDGFRDMETALGPVPDRLREQGVLLDEMRVGLSSTNESLARVRDDVGEIRVQLEETSTLLGRYRTAATDGSQLVVDIRQQVGDSAPVARLALIALGAFLVLYQVLPMWVGWRLARGGRLFA